MPAPGLSEFAIRPYAPSDLAELLALQKLTTPAGNWHDKDYVHLSRESGGLILVAEGGIAPRLRIAGFAALRLVADEAELLAIYVHPDHQSRGVAHLLLTEVFRRLEALGRRRTFLEVRPSNAAALRLYRSFGFSFQAVRKEYYQSPPEDAWVLCRDVSPSYE